MKSFGALLRHHRTGVALSLPTLGRSVGLDFSYLSRLERGQRAPPQRPVVVSLAVALGLSAEETDGLLVAAGHLPAALATLGPLDAAVTAVASILADGSMPPDERERFRQVVALLATQWRHRSDNTSPPEEAPGS